MHEKRNTKSIQFIVLSVMMLMLLATTVVNAGEVLEHGKFRYRVIDNKVEICGYEELSKPEVLKTLIIPSKIDGKKVVRVKKAAINYNNVVPDNIVCSDYMSTVDLMSFGESAPGWKGLAITLGKYTKRFLNYNVYEENTTETRKFKVPKDAKYLKVTKNGGLYSKDGKILYAVPTKKKGKFTISKRTNHIYKHVFWGSCLTWIKIPKGIDTIGKRAFNMGGFNGQMTTLLVPFNEEKRYKKMFKKHINKVIKGY